uniref:Head Tail Connector Protein n=1 Tax=Siphoviridae sp. ctLNL10 TaxID=2825453 RepID=A0A8S5Q5K0_9CAUD|nr:MAG TPA: Head Tail Connector Protein [Siphoviridae sp. ctLNL10]
MTTYDFYTGKYYGDIIPEVDFTRYESRAVDDLNDFTFGRLKGKAEYTDKEQKAVCALAEINYQISVAEKATGITASGGGIIKSMSSGGESVSYDVGNNMIYSVLNSNREQSKLKYNAAARYLRGTGLLYAGVD